MSNPLHCSYAEEVKSTSIPGLAIVATALLACNMSGPPTSGPAASGSSRASSGVQSTAADAFWQWVDTTRSQLREHGKPDATGARVRCDRRPDLGFVVCQQTLAGPRQTDQRIVQWIESKPAAQAFRGWTTGDGAICFGQKTFAPRNCGAIADPQKSAQCELQVLEMGKVGCQRQDLEVVLQTMPRSRGAQVDVCSREFLEATKRPFAERSTLGKAAVEAVRVSRGFSTDAERVVTGMRAGFRACYQRELMQRAEAQGKVHLVIQVSPDGSVRSVTVTPAAGLRQTIPCLRARAAAAEFTTTGGATVEADVTLTPLPEAERKRTRTYHRECHLI